ncbi:APG9-domain-containing protein [Paraphysoderma sedebokerense]|nr:APG9-domain-containing protein [Paraphysoderma sedebokerense]
MRLWTEVRNLDKFLDNVYQYYNGKGMYSILLKRCLNLITVAFVIIFSTFLLGCVDHTKLSSVHESQKTKLGDIVVPECWTSLGVGMKMLLFFVAVIWIWQFVRLFLDVKNLKDLHDFYTYVLEIPDCDIQSISWSDVVNKLIHICATQPSPTIQNITAIDVAHRILRKDNFLVAIFNKDLLDLSLPRNIPFFGNKKWLTKSLEWNLTFCVLNYVFDVDGAIKKRFLSENHRGKLIQGLRRRFVFMGLINAVFSPFIGLFLLMYFFFRYAGEFHRNPGSVGARQYSPLARWKLREFNEMPHLFRLRLNHSFENAMTFLDQFPRERTAAVAGFGAFIAGSFAGVLALATMLNQDILLSLEISPEKSAIFYIGVFGSIFAVAKSMIPDENLFYDPVVLMKGIVMDTHYYPAHWKGKLNTDVVRREFAEMFDYKIVLFLYEILSVVITPLILCYSLPNSSEAIIDFFREFTVHVDGVGYVCSFAAFDFKRHGNTQVCH